MTRDDLPSLDKSLSRRTFVADTAAIGALVLAGCDSSDKAPAETPAEGTAKPKRGGTLMVGVITSGASEVVVPSWANCPDEVRGQNLYDRRFDLGEVSKLQPGLASSIEPNADATVWTIKLRDGVEFRNGKSLTVDDVVYTIRSWADPASLTYGRLSPWLDYQGVRKRGPLDVEVPLKSPLAQVPRMLAPGTPLGITSDGMTLKELARNPIGTGPIKFESFEPGQQSVFTRNPNYWDNGKPYLDKLVINTSFAVHDALYNAMHAGQLDAITPLRPKDVKQQESSKNFTVLRAASQCGVLLHGHQPPRVQ